MLKNGNNYSISKTSLLETFNKIVLENCFAQCDTLFSEFTFLTSKLTKSNFKVSCLHYEVQIFQLTPQNPSQSTTLLPVQFSPPLFLPNFHSSSTERTTILCHLLCPILPISLSVCIFLSLTAIYWKALSSSFFSIKHINYLSFCPLFPGYFPLCIYSNSTFCTLLYFITHTLDSFPRLQGSGKKYLTHLCIFSVRHGADSQ